MMTEKRDDAADGELVATVDADPIKVAFAAAAAEVLALLPDGYARRAAVEEIIEAEGRTKARLMRRILN
jgi:hypothetical protein